MLKRVARVFGRDGVEGVIRRGMLKPIEALPARLHRGAESLGRAADRFAYRFAEANLVRSERELLRSNEAFRDLHRGRRCFVIGNGPSLKQQDLTPLDGEITYVVSAFWKHPVITTWQPTYYCIYDPLFFDGSEAMAAFFGNVRSRAHASTFFVPLAARHLVAQSGVLPKARTHYVAAAGPRCRGWVGAADVTRVVDSVQSVSQLALMLAIFMGCSPIYLMGLDHDWLAHRGADRHFYDGYAGLEAHPAFSPELSEVPYLADLHSQVRLWKGYEVLGALAERRGIRILNATRGGFLDVFERVSYEDLVPAPQAAVASCR